MEPNSPESAPPIEAAQEPKVETRVRIESAKPREERAVIYSYPALVYVWPIILLGYLFWITDRFGWLSPKTEAWIYVIVFVIVVLTMGVDVSRNMAVFWIAVIAAVWFFVLWLRGAKGFFLFDHIGHFFTHLQPGYSRDLGFLISLFLSVVYLIMIAAAHLNDKWVFSQNEIVHYAAFRGTTSLGRGAKGVSASYKDAFELALLFAGDIEVKSAQGNRVMARMKNVPFLWFRMRKIDRILESYAVTPGIGDEEGGEHGEEEVM
ncbi:MAG TPA: hypothetical protein PKO36_09610 [Candidatus Hydrogenedentes bacterium]|nr:hypothetical protein [Candidatus Hydrogenedentota bacterium]HOV73623.1 hypothetical protein [Candidatus Hydrogenedentota bacterium]